MLRFAPPIVLELQAGQLMHLSQRRGVELRVLRGRVWLTQPNDLSDRFLDPGQGMALGPRARALISADEPAQIVLDALPDAAAVQPLPAYAAGAA